MQFVIILFSLCCLARAEEPPPVPPDAPAWISQLTAEDRDLRQSAMEKLRLAGAVVRPLLEEAAKSDVKDRMVSAKWLLAILKTAPTLEKARAAMTATKPVTATAVLGAGEKGEMRLELQLLGDGKHARMSPLPWASGIVADGEFVWAITPQMETPGLKKPAHKNLVIKRSIEDLKAEKPGALNTLPGLVFLDVLTAAFDFTTLKEQQDGEMALLQIDGWLKRPGMLSEQEILKAVRAGHSDAAQLMAFANIPGLSRARITLEKDSLLLRKIEMQDRDAKVLLTHKFEYDYTPIAEDAFKFEMPADAEVMEMNGAMLKGMKEEVKQFIDKHKDMGKTMEEEGKP